MRRLDFLTVDPPNAGVDLSRVDGRPLSQASMYMRNNFRIPAEAPSSFEIAMPGRELRRLGVSDLTVFEQIDDRIMLECAGNGRSLMEPIPEGTPWGLGGASVIDVTGVRLADVLGAVPASVDELVFTGADAGVVDPEGEVNYQFSIGREIATSEDPLLVTHIGREPLTLDHGAPVRLIVRRHYAMMSVKWLVRIEGIVGAFDGHFVEKYRYFGDGSEPEGSRVDQIQTRSIISSPADASVVRPGVIRVAGSAWTGEGDIVDVQISLDEGQTWTETELTPRGTGITSWAVDVAVEAGPASIVACATDSTGARQPSRSRWNRNGYANNVQHRVIIEVSDD